jgi:hypothetical protein
LKELQLVSGVLRKGDEGFILFLFFQKGSFGRGEDEEFHPFPKELFLKGLG